MKTVLMSSAFALMFVPAAMADKMAVVDFNSDGVVSEADFIGSKSRIDSFTGYNANPEFVTQEVTRTVTMPAAGNTVPVAALAPQGGNYVNIGAYQGGTFGTLEATPATTRTITETRQVMVTPAPTAVSTTADVYPNPHGHSEAMVPASLINDPIYDLPAGADGVFTAAEMGLVDEEYADNRLAAYDTNKDGTVTTTEAIANLDPLLDPNVIAVAGDLHGATAVMTPELRNIGQ